MVSGSKPSFSSRASRKWEPLEAGANREPGAPKYTGDHLDGFHNKLTCYAAANPTPERAKGDKLTTRAAGFGVMRLNKKTRKITMQCFPRNVDVSDPKTKLLLDDLKQADASVRDMATQTLWQHWFRQKGEWGLTLLKQSQLALDAGELERAEVILNDVIRSQPDFAEAWNRRAVLYYLQGRHTAAIADCQHVINIIPFHFGALHGLGLCYLALKDYRAAIYAFRRALEIQPYAMANQKLLLECTMHLDSCDRP